MALSRRLPHPDGRERRAWGWAISIQLLVDMLELWAAPHTHSRALWSDLIHNANDVLLMSLSAWPVYRTVIRQVATDENIKRRWRRLAERLNVWTLVASGAFAFGLGYLRLVGEPVEVHFATAWPIAATSCIANILIYLVIRPFGHHGHIRVLGWHQLWDVASALSAMIILWAGTRLHVPQLDALAAMIIGAGMLLHWPAHLLFERNGHTHHH